LSYPVSVLNQQNLTDEIVQRKLSNLREYLNQLSNDEYMQALQTSEFTMMLNRDDMYFVWENMTAVYDQPEKIEHYSDSLQFHMTSTLASSFSNVQDELISISPYYNPGKIKESLFKKIVDY
jgi:putative cardiolipin synthase